ncbi:MAG TPA: carboxypeptidase regulatory-like domain-containing protein [Candidatus Acidoferrales bacterium]|jgi:hypothetical protein|nr:carboxypeptidase regulatory-like domain-containing protein [Candidatus Acidoferrales bacterium]
MLITQSRSVSRRRAARRIALAMAAAVCGAALNAQSNAIDAAIEGYVRDASGGMIQRAHVTVRNSSTNVASETLTNADGYFRFPLLQVGAYGLTAEAEGFKAITKPDLALGAGQKIRLDFDMQVGSQAESVEVPAETSMELADTGSSAVAGIVSRKELEDLPIVSRNIYNFQLLAPGVQGLSSPTFGTTQFAFGGNERSSWNLDGLDNTQRGGSRQTRMVITTPEAVEEVQVLSNGYSAEFGLAAGGQVNVILKSGTNQYHGSELFLYRPQSWQARPSLAAVNPEETWWDDALTFGGPIRKDRIFFFTQYDHNPYLRPNALTILPANAAALNLPANQQGTAPFGETYDTSMIFFNSGYPVHAVSGIDLNNDGISNDRPLFRGRNDVSGPGLTQFDARLQRSFTLRERYVS